MLTLEQAINDLMNASRTIAEVAESESDEANRINAQNVADDCKQIAELLRELQERRKMPEIITCGECIHRFVEDENEPFNCCTLDHNDLQSDDWYCADAERRTNDYSKIYNKP